MPFKGVVDTTAQAVATPQGTLQNSITIDNLDDKKYQDGAMESVKLEKLQQFWNQGIQRDLLGLLFISTIDLPSAELPMLRRALNNFCATNGFRNEYCGSDKSLARAEGISSDQIETCWLPNSALTFTHEGVERVRYVNDPAADNARAGAHREFCFQVMLRALIALGLQVQDQDSVTPVDKDTPANVVINPKFRAEMIKLGLKIEKNEILKEGVGLAQVCKVLRLKRAKVCVGQARRLKQIQYSVTKKDTSKVFALDPVSVFDVRSDPNYVYRANILRCDDYLSSRVDVDDDSFCHTPPGAHETPEQTRTRWKAIDRKYLKKITEDRIKAKVISLGDLKISLGERSFESMIYYLGEVVRAQDTKDSPYQVMVLGRQPWGMNSVYEERLFDLRRGAVDGEADISVSSDNGTQYWIPAFCTVLRGDRSDALGDAKQCSVEYPDHESLLVLTVVSELWGLQKEPSQEPVKTVTVGGG